MDDRWTRNSGVQNVEELSWLVFMFSGSWLNVSKRSTSYGTSHKGSTNITTARDCLTLSKNNQHGLVHPHVVWVCLLYCAEDYVSVCRSYGVGYSLFDVLYHSASKPQVQNKATGSDAVSSCRIPASSNIMYSPSS
jgi:hypothetical protein